MYQYNDLTALAYECYWTETFSNTSYILDLADITPSIEGFTDTVRGLKDKLLELLEKVINWVKKLLGIQPKVQEVTVTDAQHIKALVTVTDHYNELLEYGKTLSELGTICKVLYNDKSNKDAFEKIKSLNTKFNDLKAAINNTGNLPENYTFNYNKILRVVERLSKFDEQAHATISSLPDSNRSNKIYATAYTLYRQAVSYFNIHITMMIKALRASVTVKGEQGLLNAKRITKYKGINVIAATITDFPATSYVPTKQDIINKWGNTIIIIDPLLWKALSQDGKNFTLAHEYAHIELSNSNESDKYKGIDLEHYCDMQAHKKLGSNIKKTAKAMQDVLNAYKNLDPVKRKRNSVKMSARMKLMLEETKDYRDKEKNKQEFDDLTKKLTKSGDYLDIEPEEEDSEPDMFDKAEDGINKGLETGYKAGKGIKSTVTSTARKLKDRMSNR